MEDYKRVSKQFDKRLNKTYKNKHEFKKCDLFCRKNYVKNINQVVKKNALRLNVPYKNPTKSDNDLSYHGCKKMYCNEQCDGYENIKDIRPGFHKSYTKKKIADMKKKGILSGCFFDLEAI
jgi:hypothetical protein